MNIINIFEEGAKAKNKLFKNSRQETSLIESDMINLLWEQWLQHALYILENFFPMSKIAHKFVVNSNLQGFKSSSVSARKPKTHYCKHRNNINNGF